MEGLYKTPGQPGKLQPSVRLGRMRNVGEGGRLRKKEQRRHELKYELRLYIYVCCSIVQACLQFRVSVGITDAPRRGEGTRHNSRMMRGRGKATTTDVCDRNTTIMYKRNQRAIEWLVVAHSGVGHPGMGFGEAQGFSIF